MIRRGSGGEDISEDITAQGEASRPPTQIYFKVRTGCITCKVRRVKCDEAKPFCMRCLKAGKKCDGYVAVRSKASTTSGASTRLTTTRLQSPAGNELLCFWSASRLTDIFGHENLWKTTLHTLALDYPAIQYALVALKSAWEAPRSYMTTAQDTYTLQSYNRAITQIMRSYSFDTTQDLYSVLVACAIFICLELIRGYPKRALQHILSGIHILKERKMLDMVDVLVQRDKDRAEELNDLAAIFGRLRNQSINFDKSLNPQWTVQNFLSRKRTLVDEFKSLQHARDVYNIIYAAAFSLLIGAASLTQTAFFELAIKQHHILTNIDTWLIHFRDLSERQNHTWSPDEIKLARHAEMTALMQSIWIGTCLSPFQCSMDSPDYFPKFVSILDLAEATITEGLIASFQVDKGIVPIIHYVSIKCRDRLLRRRGLRLLRAQHWREGFYDSRISYRMVHRQISLEERYLTSRDKKLLPKEEHRITASQWEGMLDVTPDQQVLKLKLVARPSGPLEKAVVWFEDVELVGELPVLCDVV